jgi:hypothetical protein
VGQRVEPGIRLESLSSEDRERVERYLLVKLLEVECYALGGDGRRRLAPGEVDRLVREVCDREARR